MFAFARTATSSRRFHRPIRPLRLELLERRDAPAGLNSVAFPAANDLLPLTNAGLTPAMVRGAYGFDAIDFNGVAGDGRGQTIAIVTAYDHPNIESDLATFSRTFGLPDAPSFTKIAQPGTRFDAGWAAETALDVQWAHAIAPGANIVLVEAKSNRLSDLLEAVNTARHVPGVSVVSMSWGTSEFLGQSYYDGVFTTPEGHRGITFVAASGDAGAGALAWPAVSPNVVAVGGTRLSIDGEATYRNETVWSGSTGGVSQFSVDSNSLPRSVPDVAYAADPANGFLVYNSMPDSRGQTGWFLIGGTSAGAPQWAGLFAIVNQGREIDGRENLINARGALFTASSDSFNDVTSGSNGYAAAEGFDLATGLGSPRASQLVAELTTADANGKDPAFQGPLPSPRKTETGATTEPPKIDNRIVSILAMAQALGVPGVKLVAPPPTAAQPFDVSREFPEQVLPPQPPPIVEERVKPIGNSDLSLRGGGGHDESTTEKATPPSGNTKPAEDKPAEGSAADKGRAMSRRMSRTSINQAEAEAAGATLFDFETGQPVPASNGDGPAIAAAALILLGGVAITNDQPRTERERRFSR